MTDIYYDQLTPYYKYFYADWEASLQAQAKELDSVIHEKFGDQVQTILDAACGIGTQSIGLAERGYHITASDLSPGEIERARKEANSRGLKIEFQVADMRNLWEAHRKQFDVVIACDNALPHLLSDREILQAFQEFYRCTLPGGGCIISVRDYARMEKGGKRLHPRRAHGIPQGRLVIFDLWEFDGDYYDMTTYIVEDVGQPTAQTNVIRGGRYYCVTIPTLESLMAEAGFGQVQTLQDRYFQPIIVGKRQS